MNITYDYYRIFYYVAKYKNITQAADVLMSNQPNVSRAISNLEHELGCRLFMRSNRGVTLTPEGQRLFNRVSVAHQQLKAAEQELSDAKSLKNGIVSIGVSETALNAVLLPRLQKFHTLYPGIRIHISSVTTSQAITSLKAGLVDFAVVTTPLNISRPLKEIPLVTIRELLVGGPRFQYLTKAILKLEDLQNYPLIFLNSQTNTRDFYNQFFFEHGLTLLPEIEAATTDQILPMIKHDLGIGFLSDVCVKEAIQKKEVFELHLDCEVPERHISLVKDISRTSSIAVREMEKLLQLPYQQE